LVSVGSIVAGKVAKVTNYGAFVDLEGGGSGMIHISEVAARRIGKSDEALIVGETVNAKITDIDNDKKKISLSIRALLDASSTEPEAVVEEENEAE